MLSSRRLLAVLVTVAAALALSACGLMRGSDYPSKDITFVIPFAPGGTTDPVSRMLGQESEPILKGKFVMVNKAGASATLGTTEVVQAKPDGYTVGLTSITAIAVQPLVSKLPYFGPEDYQPLVKVVELHDVLAVRGDAPWKTLEDFLADAKKRPGQLRVGVSSQFGTQHLLLEEFKSLANVDFTIVPFSGGGGEATAAMLGGHIEGIDTFPATVKPLMEAGQARSLVVMTKDRNPVIPDVPSVYEKGFKLTAPPGMYVAIGPKGMDKALVDRLVKTFADAIKGPGFQKFAKDNGYVTDPIGPADLSKSIKDYLALYEKILKKLNVEIKK